jgi:hypothetical protein
VIKGFYINIVFKACLRNIGVWYNSFDYSLYYRSVTENIVLKKLERMSNLVFLKHKPLFSYPINHSNQNLVLIISTLMFPILKRKVRALYRPLKDYLKPRTDLEQ